MTHRPARTTIRVREGGGSGPTNTATQTAGRSAVRVRENGPATTERPIAVPAATSNAPVRYNARDARRARFDARAAAAPPLTDLLHPLLAEPVHSEFEISVVFGTYNRLPLLQKSISSIHRACTDLSYEIIVTDGGSTDGTRHWLREQPRVTVVDGDLSGAVRAFNAAAKIARGRYIVCLNDDAVLDEDAIDRALAHFRDPMVGQVAMGFLEHGTWKIQDIHGKPYGNFPVTRASIVRAAEAITGGMWAPVYHTYGGDNELSCWVYRLGYKVVADPNARVRHGEHRDDLRARNEKADKNRALFWTRWPSADHLRFRGARLGIPAHEQAKLDVIERGEMPADRWARVEVLDPARGVRPAIATPRAERVLHWHLWTDEDPQASMAAAFEGLGSRGHRRVDWTRLPAAERGRAFVEAARALRPTLVFLQLQAKDALPFDAIRTVRGDADRDPSLVVATWSGDVGPTKGPWPGMHDEWQYEIAKIVDLQLFTGTGQVELHRRRGMPNAAYLQIGYDVDRYHPGPEDDYGTMHSVVWMGQDYGHNFDSVPNNEAQLRRDAVAALRAIPGFCAYGSGFGTPLHQTKAGEVYRKSALAVSVSVTSELGRYSSDRMIRAMACGTPTLVKRFADMEGLGLVDGVNVIAWDTPAELVEIARTWLAPERREQRRAIGRAGADLMRTQHTWQHRMHELAALLGAVRGQR